MPITAMLLDSMIERLKIQRKEGIADVMVFLWQCLSRKVGALIGKGAFSPLYEVSLFRSRLTFPSILNDVKGKSDRTFGNLKQAIEDLDDETAKLQSIAMLESFIAVLNSLVGSTLTNKILVQAWGKDFVAMEDSHKMPNYIPGT